MSRWVSPIVITFLLTGVLFQVIGDKNEDLIRNFYRNNVCHCDTLRPEIIFDSLGIPSVNYYSTSGEHLGWQMNPVEVAKAGLRYMKLDLNDSQSKKRFINSANWLVSNVSYAESCSTLDYSYPWKPYGILPPWRSSMTHGLGLKVLITAYEETQNDVYLHTAEGLLKSFEVSIDSGGVCLFLEEDNRWYAEYSNSDSETPLVLNGFMHALLGLYHYYLHTGNEKALNYFNSGFKTLESNIHHYHRIGGSFYDRKGLMSTEDYHKIHIQLLGELMTIKDSELLKYYHDLWQKSDLPYILKRLESPNKVSVLMFTSIWIGFFLLWKASIAVFKLNKNNG